MLCYLFKGKRQGKFLVPKFDNLLKHIGCCKAKVVSLKVERGSLYFNGKCQYAQNGQI